MILWNEQIKDVKFIFYHFKKHRKNSNKLSHSAKIKNVATLDFQN